MSLCSHVTAILKYKLFTFPKQGKQHPQVTNIVIPWTLKLILITNCVRLIWLCDHSLEHKSNNILRFWVQFCRYVSPVLAVILRLLLNLHFFSKLLCFDYFVVTDVTNAHFRGYLLFKMLVLFVHFADENIDKQVLIRLWVTIYYWINSTCYFCMHLFSFSKYKKGLFHKSTNSTFLYFM